MSFIYKPKKLACLPTSRGCCENKTSEAVSGSLKLCTNVVGYYGHCFHCHNPHGPKYVQVRLRARLCMSVILLNCWGQSGFSTLGEATLYYNRVITIIIVTIGIVTFCYLRDYCDCFPCRGFYVLVSDFTVILNLRPSSGVWTAGA